MEVRLSLAQSQVFAQRALVCSRALAPNLCRLPHGKAAQPKEANRAVLAGSNAHFHACQQTLPASCGFASISISVSESIPRSALLARREVPELNAPILAVEGPSVIHILSQALDQPSDIICNIAFLQELIARKPSRISSSAEILCRGVLCFSKTFRKEY